jgi:hypothetical protein
MGVDSRDHSLEPHAFLLFTSEATEGLAAMAMYESLTLCTVGLNGGRR